VGFDGFLDIPFPVGLVSQNASYIIKHRGRAALILEFPSLFDCVGFKLIKAII